MSTATPNEEMEDFGGAKFYHRHAFLWQLVHSDYEENVRALLNGVTYAIYIPY